MSSTVKNLLAVARMPIRFSRASAGPRPTLGQRRGIRTLRRIVVALCAGLAVFFALSAVTGNTQTRPVIMAAHRLEHGHRIAARDVMVRDLPSDIMPNATFSSIAQVLGSIAQVDIERNSPLLGGSVAAIPRVPDGHTVIDIRMVSVARTIAPGDDIMLVAVTPCAQASCDEATSTVAEHALVMDLPQTSATSSGVTLPCAVDHRRIAQLLDAQEHAAIVAVAREASSTR